MSSIHVQKQPSMLKMDVHSASSVSDSSYQCESLQRKADMMNSATQREEAPRPNNTGMPDNLKSGIESLSGFSMDDVRVHYNSSKPATVQALAYTQGTDIHVAPGQEKHIPHEAWHVAQQMAGRVSPTTNINGMPVNDNAALEHEADVMGEKASAGLGTTRQLKKKKSNSSNTIQCERTVLLNSGSRALYEIGFIMFGATNDRISNTEKKRRNTVSSQNPDFAGIIRAGHTMLHGTGPDTLFSYGFWTDNMGVPGLADAFNHQMEADATNVQGVAGEYRNDTHLSMIMSEDETRVVIRVSQETFKKWQAFVTTDLDRGCLRYTFHAGAPGMINAGYNPGCDNCVSFAMTQMLMFISQCLGDDRTQGDWDALLMMSHFVLDFIDSMQVRVNTRHSRAGLQGVLMALVQGKPATMDPMYAATASPYNASSISNDSIHEEQLGAYVREDCDNLRDIIRSSAEPIIPDEWLQFYIEDCAVRRVDSLLPIEVGKYDQALYAHYFHLYMTMFMFEFNKDIYRI